MFEPKASNVVARYADGKLLKGHTFNFNPTKTSFHLGAAENPSGKGTEVWLKDLKAVFFVRSFEGNPDYRERKDPAGTPPPGTRTVRVDFADGETLVGYTMGYDPQRAGFFFSPVDSSSNNLRVFALFAAVRSVSQV